MSNEKLDQDCIIRPAFGEPGRSGVDESGSFRLVRRTDSEALAHLALQLAAANAEVERLNSLVQANESRYAVIDMVYEVCRVAESRNAELEAEVARLKGQVEFRGKLIDAIQSRLAAADVLLKNTWTITLKHEVGIVLIDQVWGSDDGTAPNYFTLRRLGKNSKSAIEAMLDGHGEVNRFKSQIDAYLAAVAAGWIAAEQPQPKEGG